MVSVDSMQTFKIAERRRSSETDAMACLIPSLTCEDPSVVNLWDARISSGGGESVKIDCFGGRVAR